MPFDGSEHLPLPVSSEFSQRVGIRAAFWARLLEQGLTQDSVEQGEDLDG